jgi:hypothetical protein
LRFVLLKVTAATKQRNKSPVRRREAGKIDNGLLELVFSSIQVASSFRTVTQPYPAAIPLRPFVGQLLKIFSRLIELILLVAVPRESANELFALCERAVSKLNIPRDKSGRFDVEDGL